MSEEQKDKQESKEEPWKEEEKTRLESLEHSLNEEKKRSEEYLTRLKYAQADLENFKKRCDRQIEEVRKYGNEGLTIELLDIVDELEMAVQSGRSSNSSEVLIEGVEMTLKKLRNVLKNEGVLPIECLGKSFDPSKHDAVARIEKEGVKDCTVVEELRKGYMMKEKVIRPSIVKVAVKPSSESQMEMSSDG
jgi:molecular chaperone GrpE